MTAAASSAAAVAASVALPQAVVRAVDQPLLLNTGNSATGSTTLSASLAMDTVLGVVNSDASGPNTALQASSDTGTAIAGYTTSGTGVYADSMGPGRAVRAGANTNGTGVVAFSGDESHLPADTTLTGVFGYAEASGTAGTVGAGVWGVSPDVGVYGSGGTGVYGYGPVGLYGSASTSSAYGLWVKGRVKLENRSGRLSVAAGKTSVSKSVAGVTTSSIVIAVLQQAETGTWVRAAVATTGKFTVYFNRALPSSSVVGWIVLN